MVCASAPMLDFIEISGESAMFVAVLMALAFISDRQREGGIVKERKI